MNNDQVNSTIVVQVSRRHRATYHQALEVGRDRGARKFETTMIPSEEQLRGLGHRSVNPRLIVRVPVGHKEFECSVVVDVERNCAETSLGSAWGGKCCR
jgi:hypothetical protein